VSFGVDEIARLLDFGIGFDDVMASLERLAALIKNKGAINAGRGRLVVNADAMIFDDPEQSRERFLRCQREHSSDCCLHSRLRLAGQAQYNDAGVLRGWIGVNVRKIEIKRDERSAFANANIYNTLIRLTAERLRDNRMRVVAFDCE